MTSAKRKVAIIGSGMIANAGHIPAWKNLSSDVDIVAAASLHLRSAQETAARHGIPAAYDDPQRMLDEVQPDIVSVCTPNASHKTWAVAALQAGAHVFCEKPVAVSFAEAQEMYTAAIAANRLLYVTQTARFGAETRAAKEVVDSGRLGKVYYAEISAIRRRGIPRWGYFHMSEYNAGGPLYDLGVHIIDALFWILGNPAVKSVSGMTYSMIGRQENDLVASLAESGAPAGVFTPRPYKPSEFDVEDLAAGYIRLENGTSILMRTSWAVNLPENFNMLIAGSGAGLQTNPLRVYEQAGGYQTNTEIKIPPDPNIPFYGHWPAAQNMLAAIRGQEEPLVKEAEVLNVIRVIEGLYRSAEEQREVIL